MPQEFDELEIVPLGTAASINYTFDGGMPQGPPGNSTGNSSVTISQIVGLSIFFCIIGIIGIVGNTLVIFIILWDRKMRRSVTNLFIMNLAVSDLLIMLFGIPEIAMFMINRGWLLGTVMCKIQRYVLVFSVYSSVITQVSVCVERYIAIVHPIQAHIFCSRRRMLLVITFIWPIVLLLSLPVVLYNQLLPIGRTGFVFCATRFPGNHLQFNIIFKYLEFILFYLAPMIIQITCYVIIGRQLFAGTEHLHRKQVIINQDGVQRERTSDAIKARRGVVKMLIASVIIYFVSYSPHQILLFYNTFSHKPFHSTWVFLVFVTAMGYVNSAANPVLYCIFSQNFRQKFHSIFASPCTRKEENITKLHMTSTDSQFTRYTRVPTKLAQTDF